MDILIILLIGICIGSFLNVCISRIPKEESIVFPPSHCTTCGYKLKAKDLIPVLSYIFLNGRCRKCNEKISIKYPLVEILNALAYLLLYLKLGLNLNFIFFSILSSLLIVISFIDFETKDIYLSTIIFGIILASIYILIGIYTKEISLFSNFLGGFIGYLIIYTIVITTRGMGEGDAEIAGVCGLFIGIKGILVSLFIGVVTAGIVASIILLLKLKDKKSEIAFGPYIALGTYIYLLFGNEILHLYLTLL